jgi:uncharacterized membrane protein
MKTIAQQLNIKEFPFEIKNKNGNTIYYEISNGYWIKCEYDSNGNEIYYENSDGFWSKREYNSNGNEIRHETSDGYWSKREYDSNGKEIYYENSKGTIIDNRPKQVIELTLEDIAKLKGVSVSQIRIKE